MPVQMIELDEVTMIELSDEALEVFIKNNAYTTSTRNVTGLNC
jgi:hypothetical protein